MDRPLIPIYLILAFIGFRMLMTLFYPVFVLIHELGHAIPARLTGIREVQIMIGEKPPVVSLSLMGIHFQFGNRSLYRGYTAYPKNASEGTIARIFIYGTAPVISLALVFTGIYAWRAVSFNLMEYFILTAAWLCNFHIAFSSLWPFRNAVSLAGRDEDTDYCYKSDLLNLIDAFGKKN